MAERSKALRSGRSLVLQAWVRIPLLTNSFRFAPVSCCSDDPLYRTAPFLQSLQLLFVVLQCSIIVLSYRHAAAQSDMRFSAGDIPTFVYRLRNAPSVSVSAVLVVPALQRAAANMTDTLRRISETLQERRTRLAVVRRQQLSRARSQLADGDPAGVDSDLYSRHQQCVGCLRKFPGRLGQWQEHNFISLWGGGRGEPQCWAAPPMLVGFG